MTSHKDRIESMQKGFSLPRNYYRNSQNGHLNSHPPTNEGRNHHSHIEKSDSNDNELGHEPNSPVYQNMQSDQVKFETKDTLRSQKSLDRQPLHQSQQQMASLKTNNTSRGYINTRDQRTLSNSNLIHKSQSLNALKTLEPSKTFGKSSIQQEYHDRQVQEQLSSVDSGKSKRPCQIATIMFIIFGICFITGLTLICLTYIYKNIFLSLDQGEMIGPVIMAGSFVFLGVGVKFVYDAYRIARAERRHIAYRGYDRHYVGLKKVQNGTQIPNEKLVSGKVTDIGVSRIPNRKLAPVSDNPTLGRSSQQVYGKVYDNSEL